MSVAWNPFDNDDIEVKKAFDALGRSADKVVLPSSDPAQPNRFILRSKSYFDVQAYVLSGKDFPETSSDVDNRIPERTFQKLSEFDREIYSRTRKAMVAVGSTCRDYHQNHLVKLVTPGQTASQYSDTSVELLETAVDMNLRHNLDIIMDEKYTSPDRFDDTYMYTKEAVKMALQMLQSEARDKQQNTDAILQTLIQFRERTLENQSDVKFLAKQYKTGPVENKSNTKTPYFEILNKDLTDNLVNFDKKVKEVQDKSSDWEKSIAVPVGTCWFGPLGWIVMGIHGAKAPDLRQAYDDLEILIAKYRRDRQEETELIKFVNQLATQYTDIDQKIADAIAALTELSLFFRNQADCYDNIAVSIDRMKTNTDSRALRSRKQYVQYQMKVTVDKLKNLNVVAQEFTRSVLTQIKL